MSPQFGKYENCIPSCRIPDRLDLLLRRADHASPGSDREGRGGHNLDDKRPFTLFVPSDEAVGELASHDGNKIRKVSYASCLHA